MKHKRNEGYVIVSTVPQLSVSLFLSTAVSRSEFFRSVCFLVSTSQVLSPCQSVFLLNFYVYYIKVQKNEINFEILSLVYIWLHMWHSDSSARHVIIGMLIKWWTIKKNVSRSKFFQSVSMLVGLSSFTVSLFLCTYLFVVYYIL